MSKANSKSAANKVIPLNGPGLDRNPGQRILAECREQLVNSLCTWLQEIATPISEELFALANSSRERALQVRYSGLRANIDKDWPQLVETFRRELSAEAENCQNRDSSNESSREAPRDVQNFENLRLLDDEDLTKHIIVREFSNQLSESCDEELYSLDRRVAELQGHDEPSDSENPLAPAIVCRALSDACATIGSDAETRLLLLRRLERHLHKDLSPIYKQINAYLNERNILPEIKRDYRRHTPAGGSFASSNGQSSAGFASSSNGQSSAGFVPSSGEQDSMGSAETGFASAPQFSGEGIMEVLQRLAQLRVGQQQAPAAVMPGVMLSAPRLPQPVFSQASQAIPLDTAAINQFLLSSLNEMQHVPVLASDSGSAIVNQVRIVRDSENAKQVGGLEAVTIDIVAMLFDFIFDDPHIPVAIKALISRLQIPVLKVAMLNPSFFADRQHPTRRFLGSVAGVSIRWGTSVDETDPFYCKLAELIEKIQTGFETDIEVFGTALAELEIFVNEHESEEDTTALTAANIVIRREHESEGWERAQRVVRTFRTNNAMPPLIDAFLREHWIDVMQAIAVNNDEDSTDWQAAEEVMKDLAWSVEAKKTPDDRLKLISMLPGLLARINKGLDNIDAGLTQRSAFFDALVQYHSAALKGGEPEIPTIPIVPTPETSPGPADASAPAAAPVTALAPEQIDLAPSFSPPPPPPSEEGDLLVTRSVNNGIEVEEVILVGASPIWRADEREIFRQVSELKRGDWVEFHDEEDSLYRERLHWISPQRGILLFSNHRSSKAISFTPEALARHIRDGKASILQKNEIFERALNGALESINAAA